MEGLRVIGKPGEFARRYADGGADELLYLDTVASLYGRNQLAGLLDETTREVFIPVTVGGGIKSRADAKRLLDAGADKVAINTEALRRPEVIDDLAGHYGSQAVVVSIEAKRHAGGYECYSDNGREKTGLEVGAWARQAVERGAGEILITSIDRDGTRLGADLEIISLLSSLPVPVTYSGGLGSVGDCIAARRAGADALVIGAALHAGKVSFKEIRDGIAESELQAQGRSNEGRGEARPEGRV